MNKKDKMLEEEIARVQKKLSETEVGTDKYKEISENLDSLYQIDLKGGAKKKLDFDKFKVWLEFSAKVLEVGAMIGGTIYGIRAKQSMFWNGLKYEDTGFISSDSIKKLMNFDPTRK